jgi:hypothetical protein
VAIKVEVVRSDLAVEAGFPQPEFWLFRDVSALLHRLHTRLQPHGLKLTDLRLERATGNVAEQHVLCYLFDYLMTVRVRVERVEVNCSALPSPEYLDKFKAATLDVLRAVKDLRADLSFRAFAVAVGVHAKLEGQSARDYLTQFVAKVPQGLGASTGNGIVFYFGPEGERLLSSVTVDASALVPDGVFARIHGVWDASKIAPESLTGTAEAFVRQGLESLGLQVPA